MSGALITEQGPWALAWRKLRRRPAAMFGLLVVLMFVVVALCAPWIATHDPIATSWSAIRKEIGRAHV